MKNLDLLKLTATTKYSDWKGVISIDNYDYNGIEELCIENGVDCEDYFIVGFGIEDGGLRSLHESYGPTCSVLLLNKSKYGATADQIIENTRGLDKVGVIRKTFNASYADIGKVIKRLSLMTLWKTRDYLPDMFITEEEL